MNEQPRIFTAMESDIGLRLDKFLALKMPEFSRNEIQKFEIKQNQKEVKLSAKLREGDVVEVIIPEKTSTTSFVFDTSSSIKLEILFEDDDVIVVNKPRGVAMYPGAGREADTLVHSVLAHTKLSILGGELRPGVVHRLDKDTSGVVILAKSDTAFRALVKVFAEHDLTRKYIAFVWGVPNWTEADIEGNIGRSTRNRQKMSMLNRGGKEAKTLAEVLNVWTDAGISKMRCTLFTGRTHQIRVHLSAHGFPVVCDPLYGRGNARLGSVKNPELLEFLKTHQGQMLHAEVLEFVHPTTGEQMKFKAKLPEDMKELQSLL
ncbi:MAG: RluA family pseudouridine synthase [Alphaproteobacteria bacterium]|nr:RluA family pseudouridine synthase [Alphaproteobacteria bacterium]